jgi:hypothetical protein
VSSRYIGDNLSTLELDSIRVSHQVPGTVQRGERKCEESGNDNSGNLRYSLIQYSNNGHGEDSPSVIVLKLWAHGGFIGGPFSEDACYGTYASAYNRANS